jgi:hypothetical protein
VSSEAIIRRVDHVYVPLEDPLRAFTYLTEQLELPVAWPLSDYGVFTSGGVSLGNLNLEVLSASDGFVFGSLMRPARIRGIAVEPVSADETFLGELDRRDIPHGPPAPFTPPGASTPMWTNVGIGVVEGTISGVFACKYHFDVEPRRVASKTALDARDGGRLGLIGAAELVMGSPDPDVASERWQRLLDPLAPAAPGRWRFPAGGPDVRIVASTEERCERLVLTLRDPSVDLSELSKVLGGLELDAVAA